jgi:hypothetical protein
VEPRYAGIFKNDFVGDKLGHITLAMGSRYVNHDAAFLRALSDQMENRVSAPMGFEHREGIVFPQEANQITF